MESEDSALERESELDGESSKDQNNGEEMALFRKIRRGVKKKRINCSFFFCSFLDVENLSSLSEGEL